MKLKIFLGIASAVTGIAIGFAAQSNQADYSKGTTMPGTMSGVIESPAPAKNRAGEIMNTAPKTEQQIFTETLVSATPGLLAQEQVSIFAPSWYENREALFQAVDSQNPSDAELLIGDTLRGISLENDLSWDDALIENMSEGVVKGLYKWENR